MIGKTGHAHRPERLARTWLALDGTGGVRIPLSIGDTGVIQTLAGMSAVARITATRMVQIRDNRSTAALAHAIWQFLSRMHFQRDPDNTELLRSPYDLVNRSLAGEPIWGDCDDRATLGAAMALSAGLRPFFKVIGQRENGPYEHVYMGVADDDESIIWIDPQETDAIGEEVPYARSWTVRA